MSFKFLLSGIRIGSRRKIPFPYLLWFALALIAVLAELLHHSINNYLIFKNVFWHVLHQANLYSEYPQEYIDHNLYGPIFSLVIAPFAVLPDWLGVILWVLANGFFLFYAIKKLPFTEKAIKVIVLIAAIEFMTSSHNVQFNSMVASWIIFSYIFVKKENDFLATFFIALGFFVKIYGIVGILFFVFSRHKPRFIASFLFWLVLLFFLPMVISSPTFIIQTYKDWFQTLSLKNLHNINISYVNMQDLSVMGIVRRVTRNDAFSNLTVLVPAAILLALPLLRFKLYKNVVFQVSYLSLVLISVVIFSSGAESATYVIAMAGVAIWYVLNMHQNERLNIVVLVFALFITSLGSTDLVPQIIKHNLIRAYALKALPCFVVWIMLIYNVAFKKEDELQTPEITEI